MNKAGNNWSSSRFWIQVSVAVTGIFSLLSEAWQEYERDRARYLATAMIYYALVSLIPLLLLLLSVLGLLLRFSTFAGYVQQQVLGGIEASLGTQMRVLIEQLLETLQRDSITGSLIGLVGLLLTASVLFRHLRLSFRAIWRHEPTLVSGPMRVAVWATLLEQIKAFGLMLVGGAMLIIALILIAMAQWVNSLLNVLPLLSRVTGWMLTAFSPIVLAILTFALLFKYLPPVALRLRDVRLATLLCAVAWWVAGEFMTLYGTFFGGSRSAYGALGGLLVVMLWMNVLSQVLFFGAELCKVVASRDRPSE